ALDPPIERVDERRTLRSLLRVTLFEQIVEHRVVETARNGRPYRLRARPRPPRGDVTGPPQPRRPPRQIHAQQRGQSEPAATIGADVALSDRDFGLKRLIDRISGSEMAQRV